MFNNLKSFREAQHETNSKAKGVIKEALKELFAAFPILDSVKWTQYTPYFNDGDACTFSVNDVYIKFSGVTGTRAESVGDWGDGWLNLDYEHEILNEIEQLDEPTKKSLIKTIELLNKELQGNEDALYAAFGDHVEVIVDRTNIDAVSYSHD